MGWMVRQREFIFYDSGYHRASPDAGAKAISHRAGLQDVGQLLALALRDSGRTAGAVSFQNSLHPINLPALQPQANIRAMNFKDISNFGSGSALHIESHGVKPVSHPIGTIAQGLLAELNQLLNFLGSSTDLYRSHATSCLSVTCYMMSCYLCNPIYHHARGQYRRSSTRISRAEQEIRTKSDATRTTSTLWTRYGKS